MRRAEWSFPVAVANGAPGRPGCDLAGCRLSGEGVHLGLGILEWQGPLLIRGSALRKTPWHPWTMGKLRRMVLGHEDKETAEQRVRRLNDNRFNGYIQPVVPAIVELYDKIAALEARIEELSSKA